MTFDQSLKQLPIKRIGPMIHVGDWDYSIRHICGKNKKTKEVFYGSFYELLIERRIWNEDMLI